ncbi:MAG: hypothetical protein K2X81_14630, partial [Candidatus Obscuribacterales bacterium]|nr:hypothetical protein [Candidatus Obscuribacterales bacterium]
MLIMTKLLSLFISVLVVGMVYLASPVRAQDTIDPHTHEENYRKTHPQIAGQHAHESPGPAQTAPGSMNQPTYGGSGNQSVPQTSQAMMNQPAGGGSGGSGAGGGGGTRFEMQALNKYMKKPDQFITAGMVINASGVYESYVNSKEDVQENKVAGFSSGDAFLGTPGP